MYPLHFLLCSLRSPRPHPSHLNCRTFFDAAVKCVRDRGLDHAVEREKNLLPLINTKNLIKSEPSKSLPISIIAENRASLKIPTRPIEFIRKYPSVFCEFLPGGIGFQPHIKLTDEVLYLDSEEQLMYQSVSYKKDIADRVLKLLMLCRANKFPLTVVENLKWDLGLPPDYEQSIIPEFPDYFRIAAANGPAETRVLELVCWIGEFGTSVMEKKLMNGDSGYTKGMPLSFPMKFSRGFEMDKKFKKWVDDWQKLPYVSPYENADYLFPKSDESDKWAVAVLHELLHILIPKKTEKENVLFLGEHLGLRSRFKQAMLNHPGIFYLSSKIGTCTLLLKEGYDRDSVIEKHPLIRMRSRYIHLMNRVNKDSKPISVTGGSENTEKPGQTASESKGEKEENEVELHDSSDAGVDDNGSRQGVAKDIGASRRRLRTRNTDNDEKGRRRNPERGRSAGERPGRNSRERVSPKVSTRTEKQEGRGSTGRSNLSKSRGRVMRDKRPS